MTLYTNENKSSLAKLEDLTEEELLEIYQIQQEQDRRIRDQPLDYFWPHQRECDGRSCSSAQIVFETFDGKRYSIRGCPQFEFLNATNDTKAFFGGNRSGKTTAGAVAVGYFTTGQYPDWYTGRKWDRPTTGRIFANDFAKGVKVVTKALKQWIPKASIVQIKKNNQGADVEWTIRHKDGRLSFFDIMTYEQNPDSAEGANQDWLLFDEPPPRSMYIAATRGLIDNDGICMFTLTPLKEPWLFDEIYNSKDKNIYSVLCDLRHNLSRINPLSKKVIGLREESIRKFERKLTEEERETRMHGKFRYLAGRIWQEWERSIHTFDRSLWVEGKNGVVVDGQPPIHWPRIMLIDPHDRRPHALIWIACDDTMNFWAYREAWLKNCLIGDVVKYIKEQELMARERIQQRIIDPNFGPRKYANSGLSVRDEFEQESKYIQYPIRFAFGDDRKEVGRKAFAKLLKYDPTRPISLLNHPKIRVASDMKETIYQVEHYIWDDFKSTIEKDVKEQPKDINTHFPDLFHYFALSKFGWRKLRRKEGRGNYYG